MNSWIDSFIPQLKAIEAFQYPGHVMQLQKEQQIQAKRINLHEKICAKNLHENDASSKLFTNSLKISDYIFCK